jgi:hypothetical protein
MKRSINQQVILKPQDLAVLLKIAISAGPMPPYAVLARTLWMSPSEVHASLARANVARLAQRSENEGNVVIRPALLEFVLFGARYAFPPVSGPLARGLPTAYAGPGLRGLIVASDEPVPVWPAKSGKVRGMTLYPLYPNLPLAAEADENFYETLALFDALRIGAARERNIATEAFTRKLA